MEAPGWKTSILGVRPPPTPSLRRMPRSSHPRTGAGNAVEPFSYIFLVLLGVCVLSGHWWLMGYALCGAAFFGVVLLYALYLEYNTQNEMERRAKQSRARPKPRNASWAAPG